MESSGEKALSLDVHTVSEIPGRTWSVTGGIPFPEGNLAVGDGVRLVDASGGDVPVQTEVLAT